MKKLMTSIITLTAAALILTGSAFAMEGHDMKSSDRIGDLFHESMVDGYMLSYYLMDMRDQKKDGKASDHSGHAAKEMDKPHHIMVYIMDKNHKPVLKGKVGFLIKGADGKTQKIMGMYMSEGFGITADMKKKGEYAITTKAVLGDVKLMDKFTHEMK
ncbi:MAG TPA: hypothetical protein DHV36_13955 [Desulfobacteraceae bacterium]|nr:hypothetical protein [Desulfobacteraceae bacterium]|tara:strand:- start:140 stop:613 length:474 start_codon:yes stop_codon:yes gene_type:complete